MHTTCSNVKYFFVFVKCRKLTKCGGSVPNPQAIVLDWIDIVNGFQNGSVSVYILRVAKVVRQT